MSRKTLYFLGILAAIVLGTIFYWRLCSDCQMASNSSVSHEEVSIPIGNTKTPTSYPFAVSDVDYAFETQDNFNFKGSSPSFLMPISEHLKNGIESLKSYLVDNPKKTIDLIGFHTSAEENNSAFPSLGLARATSVKNQLVLSGIPSSQINTKGELKESMIPDGDTFLGPISYSISEMDDNAGEQLGQLYEKIKDNPLILYFQTGESAISLSVQQRQKIADISNYLDKVDGALCQVVGHTDNTGDRTTNIRLGQERADFVKGYLISNGIAKSKISTSSAGPDIPIASNETEEGRAKNRRTIVTLN